MGLARVFSGLAENLQAMAYVLLVDPDEVAQVAMKGLLARGKHRCAAVSSVEDALSFVRSNVKVDLVVTELKLAGEGGVVLIQKLKGDRYLQGLPVVVYTAHADRESVKQALGLHAQNFLLKPYRDESVFAEIGKSLAAPWRAKLLAEERLVCQARSLTLDELRGQRTALREGMARALGESEVWMRNQAIGPAMEALKGLIEQAAELGVGAVLAALRELREKSAGGWAGFVANINLLRFGERLLFYQLKPESCPEPFLTDEERNVEIEARQRASWASAPGDGLCPVVSWDLLKRAIDGMTGCPVVGSIAASFQMAANGHPTSLSPLLDLVQKDPGLTAEILIASNRLKKGKQDGNSSPIEEPRMAVGLLGELRLATLGRGFVTVEDRMLLAPPHGSWPSFRMFQLATARMARFACNYLELPSIETAAYTAGLLHDIGKLLLVHLHPFAFQAICDYAVKRGQKLATAERYFLEATTHEMGAYFGEKHGLPARLVNVLRWIDAPHEATEDAELVAVVSLARDLCRHNHVGYNGDTPKDDALPLEETAEWAVLRHRVYLNFDLKKFEQQAHLECRALKRELLGVK